MIYDNIKNNEEKVSLPDWIWSPLGYGLLDAFDRWASGRRQTAYNWACCKQNEPNVI